MDITVPLCRGLGTPVEDRIAVLETGFEYLDVGLCFFDGRLELVVCNSRATELLELSSELTRPGVTYQDLAGHLCKRGAFGTGADAPGVEDLLYDIAGGVEHARDLERTDGTLLRLNFQPLPGGGLAINISRLERPKSGHATKPKTSGAAPGNGFITQGVEAVLNSVPEGIIVTDQAGTILMANTVSEKIFGIPCGGLKGRPMADLLPASTAAARHGPREELGIGADGAEIPLSVTVGDLAGGKTPLFSWVVRDISEDKRTAGLLNQQKRLIGLLHNVAVATGEADNVSDAIEICVDAICSHTGWPLGHAYDCKGDLMKGDIWHPHDHGRFQAYAEACRAASAMEKTAPCRQGTGQRHGDLA